MDAWEQLLSGSTITSGDAWEHLLAQGGGGTIPVPGESIMVMVDQIEFALSLVSLDIGFVVPQVNVELSNVNIQVEITGDAHDDY